MKLKKIASLALAGVMAVSMLAGCANKTPETGNNGEGEGEVANVTIASILNDAQDADNKAKIVFSDNALLNTAMQSAVAEYGLQVGNNATDAAEKAGVKKAVPSSTVTGAHSGYFDTTTSFLNEKAQYYVSGMSNLAGTYTYVKYEAFKGYADQASALKAIGKYMDDFAAKLPTTSLKISDTSDKNGDASQGTEVTVNQFYYSYSYTGNAVLIVLNNVDGTTDYGLLYAVNQTVAKTQVV